MTRQPAFFDFAAEVGLTKHIGGLEATEALIELCHINAVSYVLDVGCGVGAMPYYMALRVGCHVAGVDISPKMAERSKERALAEGVAWVSQAAGARAQPLTADKWAGLLESAGPKVTAAKTFDTT